MHHNAHSAISGGLNAFAQGIIANRIRRDAYRAAATEGRRQDAQNRAIRRLAAEVQAARADAQAARADAILGDILRGL